MNAPIHTKTFKSGNSETVRLPKGIGFGIDTPISIRRDGDAVIIRQLVDPVAEKARLSAFIARLRAMPGPGEIEVRDVSEIPERAGL